MPIFAYVLLVLLLLILGGPVIGAITHRARDRPRTLTRPDYGHRNDNEPDRCGCRSCMCDVH